MLEEGVTVRWQKTSEFPTDLWVAMGKPVLCCWLTFPLLLIGGQVFTKGTFDASKKAAGISQGHFIRS